MQYSHGIPSRIIRNTWDSTRLRYHLGDSQRGDGNALLFATNSAAALSRALSSGMLVTISTFASCAIWNAALRVACATVSLLSRFGGQGVQDLLSWAWDVCHHLDIVGALVDSLLHKLRDLPCAADKTGFKKLAHPAMRAPARNCERTSKAEVCQPGLSVEDISDRSRQVAHI